MSAYNCDVPVIIMAQVEALNEKQAKRFAEDAVYGFLNMALERNKFIEVMDWDWDWKRNTNVELFMEK